MTTRTLKAWQNNRETDEVIWQLPQPQTQPRSAVLPRAQQT
ncbi:hypothetical protein [Streptomyces lanatus]|uniref:Uncharacterized protein n=1 Tax=Streptomyces lanatus TaxID=66900 RepID=A0ABV1Y3P9_9ACTN|nr:hypothetical protein [Streptomyces lanatus]